MAKKSKKTESAIAATVAADRVAGPPRWMWLTMGILSLLCVVIYAQTGTHDFVNLDDYRYITNNPNVRNGLTVPGLHWALTNVDYYYWQPLTWISHMIDCQLFGLHTGPHHLVSMVFHAINSALLLWALYLLTGSPGRSAFAAALFALHPLRVESVAWAAERKDVLSGLFWILAMAAYALYVKAPTWKRYAAVVTATALSAMSKPTVVTLPMVLLLLDFWPLGRLSAMSDLWPRVREKLPLFGISVALSLVTVLGQGGEDSATVDLQRMPLYFRIYNAITAYGGYLAKTLWPTKLSVFYPLHKIDPFDVAMMALLLVVITALAFWKARTHHYVVVGWLWFLGAMVPMIGLAQAGTQSMADRFTYIPCIGLFIAVSWLLADLWARLQLPRQAAVAACCLLSVVLAAASFQQTRYWKDSYTLFEHAVTVTQDNDFLHSVLANLYFKEGNLEKAASHTEESIRIEPNNVHPIRLAVQIYARSNQPDKAIRHLKRLALLDPNDPNVRRSLADMLWRTGHADEARRELDQLLVIAPNDLEARALRMMMNTQ